MFVDTALSVRLLVYAGLSLFIINGPYVYVVVCVVYAYNLTLYPLPKIDEMFSKLRGAAIFSTIDLRSGYYHIGLMRESRAELAFVVPMGKWQFKRTPFGLSQAPAYFQLLIDKVLMGCGEFAMGYLDDIIIFSKNEEDHLHYLEEIFSRLQHFGLKMKREKCAFFKQHIQYLGI